MRHGRVILAGVILLGLTTVSLGQDQDSELESRFLRQQRLADEELAQQRQAQEPIDSILDWQWGGWVEYYAFHFDDGVQSSRFSQRPGMALWTRVRLDDGAHEIFARLRLRYSHFNIGDEIDRQEDWIGPEFDQLWYQIDVGKAFRLTDPAGPYQMRARLGRQTVIFGTGFALDTPLDAALIDAKIHDFRVQGLFGRTPLNYPNVDSSEPVDSHSNRLFYGVQVAWEGFERHTPFVYAIWNNDRTPEYPKQWFQNYSYDTYYLGAGARGEIMHNLNYWVEGVFEGGSGYNDGDFMRRNDIEAWGFDAGIEKLFDMPTHPRLTAEYMFGSGDPDRMYSPTNARGGNGPDRRDSSFVGFGYRDTGISLAPVVSNLHVVRLGGSLKPLEQFELLREFEIGTNWFLYQKHQSRAAISDPLADNFSGEIGWEMDYFVNWRVASDLSWTVRWGTFFPGDAYSDDDPRHFVFTGVTWSF
jgi:hypothetical protein